MNKIQTQEELKGRLVEINNSIANAISNIDEYEYESTLLEVESEDVRKYLQLLRNPEVTKYINCHNLIGKNKKDLLNLRNEADQIGFLLKQQTCEHPVLLETKVENFDDSIKDTSYTYVCLECRKQLHTANRSNKTIVSKYYNQDYELSDEEINQIEKEYTTYRENNPKEDAKRVLKKIAL